MCIRSCCKYVGFASNCFVSFELRIFIGIFFQISIDMHFMRNVKISYLLNKPVPRILQHNPILTLASSVLTNITYGTSNPFRYRVTIPSFNLGFQTLSNTQALPLFSSLYSVIHCFTGRGVPHKKVSTVFCIFGRNSVL